MVLLKLRRSYFYRGKLGKTIGQILQQLRGEDGRGGEELKIGDEISVQRTTVDEKSMNQKTVVTAGRVIYINQAHHYFTVEFPSGLRESFPMTRPVDDRGHERKARSRAY